MIVVPKKSDESVTVALTGLAGSGYDGKSTGIAHFLEHMLFAGSKGYPNIHSLNQVVNDVGSRRGGLTNAQTVRYFVKSLPEASEQSYIFLSEILCRPLLSRHDVDREKTIIEQEIGQIKDSPSRFIDHKIFSLFYPNHPLGKFVTGEVDEVKTLQHEAIVDFWKKHYSAKNFVMVVVGNIEIERAQKLAETYFSEMREGEKNPILDVKADQSRRVLIENRETIQQAHFLVSFPGFKFDDDRTYASTILMRILTGGMTSRLYRRLRVEKAMIYSLRGWSLNLSFGGFNSITTAVDESRLNEALTVVNEEISRITNEQVDDDELERAVNIASAGELFDLETNEGQAASFGREFIFQGRIRTASEIKERYRAVNKSDVQKAAQNIFISKPKIVALGKSLTENLITAI